MAWFNLLYGRMHLTQYLPWRIYPFAALHAGIFCGFVQFQVWKALSETPLYITAFFIDIKVHFINYTYYLFNYHFNAKKNLV